MSRPIDILLLLALPASGKSEARTYLATLSPEECREHFGIGHTVQLDDFPYVHLMRRISEEENKLGLEGTYFLSPALPFRQPRDWGALIELVNEDYADMVAGRRPDPASAAEWLMQRLDAARATVGADPGMVLLSTEHRETICAAIEDEARDLLRRKNAEIPDSLQDKTIVIEFARGGADASPLPLPAPYGYRYSLSRLAPEILAKASILYIWVTPEESRRKNLERADPDDPGSILGHCVPAAVMYGDYGCDDIQWLLDHSEKPNTITVERDGRTHHLPLGRFDNREDKTTFIRAPRSEWRQEDIARLRAAMQKAFAELQSGQR
jgi:hypothetical protein